MKGSRVFSVMTALLIACILLSGCSRTIRSSADELCMHRWQVRMDNGNHITLSFDEDAAVFTVENDAFTLTVSGSYLVDDSTLVISDMRVQANFAFTYILHGDCIELSCGDGTVRLFKS